MADDAEKKKGKWALSITGIVLGLLAVIASVAGEKITLWMYSEPPPALLQRADGQPATSEDLKEAVSDYAHDVYVKTSRKLKESGEADVAKLARESYAKGKEKLKGWSSLLDGDDTGDAAEDAPPASEPPAGTTAPADAVDAEDVRPGEAADGETAMEGPEAGNADLESPAASVQPVNDVADAEAQIDSEAEPEPRWTGLGSRFKTNFSGRSDRQKNLLGIFDNFGLYGGVVAIVFGVLGWVRKENFRLCLAAGIFGGIAIIWMHLAMALGIAIAIVILSFLSA